MLTLHFVSKQIKIDEVFCGLLKKHGINELVTHESTGFFRHLTDQLNNDIIVIANEAGLVTCLINSHSSTNSSEGILHAIATEFNCRIHSELELE